jgi:hypothetical protein
LVPFVQTLNLLRVIEWMENEPKATKNVGFHASTASQDYVEGVLKAKGGKARLTVRAS